MTQSDEDYFEHSQELEMAIEGDRHEATKMWEQIANGDFNREVRYFLQSIAPDILDAGSQKAGAHRDRAISRAVGLSGTADRHRALREWCEVLRDFEFTRAQIIKSIRSGRPPPGVMLFVHVDPRRYNHMTDAELGKLIDSELKRNPKN